MHFFCDNFWNYTIISSDGICIFLVCIKKNNNLQKNVFILLLATFLRQFYTLKNYFLFKNLQIGRKPNLYLRNHKISPTNHKPGATGLRNTVLKSFRAQKSTLQHIGKFWRNTSSDIISRNVRKNEDLFS